MNNISGTGNKKLYLVTDYNLIENGRQFDNFEVYPGAEYMNEIKNTDQEATYSTLANAILNTIYHSLRGRIDKVICISCHENSIYNFMQATNVLDTLAEILDIYNEPNTLIINIVPFELNYIASEDEINIPKFEIDNLVNKFEYLGFRSLPMAESEQDMNILMYMNPAGINVCNATLKTMEYDYGK